MAYSTLVSLERIIDEIFHHNQFSISPHEKKQIISLDKYVISLRAFLEDFPEKAKILEARIRDVAVEAEDAIEWFMTEQISNSFRSTDWITELKRIKFRFQLLKLRNQMESIAGEVVGIKNSIIIKDAQLEDSVGASSSSSQIADAGKVDTVGLNQDLIEIMARLCQDSPQLQILPITGMGGIGKTTLARNAYDAPLIMEHFQIRAWLTISQDYSERRILSDLLHSLKEFVPKMRNQSVAENSEESNENTQQGNECRPEISEESNENAQQPSESRAEISEESNSEKALKVHKILMGRRFLIVMDDMWNTKVLNDAKKLFPNDNNGSRILLTTRQADVAEHSYEMRLMDVDQSWNLLRKKVFGRQDFIPTELNTIGREIARSCGGLPLAMVVVAGILSTVSRTQTSWEEIARNVESSLATTDARMEKILSLSYNHLPQHLRPCFLYMGGFPKDHEIKVMDLIRLWIAEGFVKPVASKSFEDSAEEYVEDLIRRSLVLPKNKSNGKIKSCKLHDLIRDLCIKQSHQEKFLVHVDGQQLIKDERRICISYSEYHIYSLANIFSSTIRTILCFQLTLGSFGSYRLLRVLDVLMKGQSKIPRSLPDQIFELFHLRYLAFCSYKNNDIPRAISNLQSLQTLIIRGFGINFPREIWNMPQLRHLILLDSYSKLPSPFGAASALENLQTLVKVRDLVFSLRVLNMIPNLKKLSLSCSRDFESLRNLVHLHRLEKLKLEFNHWSFHHYGSVPNLVLPSSLKKLALIGWGSWGPPYLNIVCPLPNLEVLKLRRFDFMELEWTTSDQDFPNLRFLLIEQSNLEQWNSEGSHFPLLEHLLLHSCWSLSEIPDGIGEIPTLQLVEVKDCKKSLADFVKLMQEEQQDYGDDVFQVRCNDCELA